VAVKNAPRPYLGDSSEFDFICPDLNVLGRVAPGGLPGLVLGPYLPGADSKAKLVKGEDVLTALHKEKREKVKQLLSMVDGSFPVTSVDGVEELTFETWRRRAVTDSVPASKERIARSWRG